MKMRFAVLLVAIGLAGCSGGAIVAATPSGSLPLASQSTSGIRLYIPEQDNVYVYAPGSPKLLESLPISAGALTADAQGNLYAATLIDLAHHIPPYIGVWAPGGETERYAIHKGLGVFNSWAVSRSGELYVGTYTSLYKPGRIAAFARGSKSAAYGIANVFCGALVTDRAENLYAACSTGAYSSSSSSFIAVYKPGASTPIREITQGLNLPAQMQFDSHGNLYVYNQGKPGSISVYKPGASKPKYTITFAFGCPCSEVVGGGEVYVASEYDENIAVYAAGAATPHRSIRLSKADVTTMALDPSGNLYVCCTKAGISVFRNGQKFWYSIPRQSTMAPVALVFART